MQDLSARGYTLSCLEFPSKWPLHFKLGRHWDRKWTIVRSEGSPVHFESSTMRLQVVWETFAVSSLKISPISRFFDPIVQLEFFLLIH